MLPPSYRGANEETEQLLTYYVLICKNYIQTIMIDGLGQVRRRCRGVDQIKVGTQLASARSLSRQLEQGHVVAMLG